MGKTKISIPAWLRLLRKRGINDSRLARDLGYAHSSAMHRRIRGLVDWTAEDALKIESLSGGQVKAEKVAPKLFKSIGDNAAKRLKVS